MSQPNPVEQFFKNFVEITKEDPPLFDIKAPVKLAALDHDSRYRMIDLKDEEFFFKGIRAGKRSEWIIELTPVASTTYKQVEIPDKDLAQIMPLLEPYLVKALGFEGSKFRPAIKKWIKKAEDDAATELGQVESKKYNGNSSWGTF